MIGFLNALSHFLVDGVCVSALFINGTEAMDLALAVVVYNTMAFSTQCLVGLILDAAIPSGPDRQRALRIQGMLEAVSMMMVAIGFWLPLGPVYKAILIGLGNSLFHVAGGIITLKRSGGKAAPLGVFVAPGAFGVTLGTAFPGTGKLLSIALLLMAFLCLWVYRKGNLGLEAVEPSLKAAGRGSDTLILVLLSLAVAVRAVGGVAVDFPWKTGISKAFLMTLFVFLGKALGGFICDRFGASRSSLVSVIAATVFIAFFSRSMPLSLGGQLLLNLSMPVTLWLMYMAIPDEPGLAFGLAASALWPGTMLGQLIKLTGPAQKLLIIACFLFSLFAIIYSDKKSPAVKCQADNREEYRGIRA